MRLICSKLFPLNCVPCVEQIKKRSSLGTPLQQLMETASKGKANLCEEVLRKTRRGKANSNCIFSLSENQLTW